jgi:AbrB family looped-hinge helix DNA binding protein
LNSSLARRLRSSEDEEQPVAGCPRPCRIRQQKWGQAAQNGISDGNMVFMNATIEIDKAGRIVVPKKLRDALHLVPGTRLRIERSGDRLVMEPALSEPQVILRDGMWVVSGSPTVDIDIPDLIRQGYEERAKRIMEGSGLE